MRPADETVLDTAASLIQHRFATTKVLLGCDRTPECFSSKCQFQEDR
jgi:hypothetical protein